MSHGLPETPWGGFKESGIGRTHGEIGFAEMTQPQVIVHDRLGRTRRNLWWQPYSRRLFDGLQGALGLLRQGTAAARRFGPPDIHIAEAFQEMTMPGPFG